MDAPKAVSLRHPIALEDMCEGLADELAAYRAAIELQLMADSTPEAAAVTVDPDSLPASACDCVYALGVIPGAYLVDTPMAFATCKRRLQLSQLATQPPLE